MRPRSLARSLALALVVSPGVAFADPPAATTTSAPAAPAAAPAAPATPPAGAAQNAAPQLPAPGIASKAPKATKATKTAVAAKSTKGGKKKKGAKDAPLTGAPIVTYPGFRMLDGGGSRVLVALSKKVNVTETKAAGKLTYRIQGVQVPTRNNQRALLTQFFSTPVSRAELVPRDNDVDLVIDAKNTSGVVYRVIETDKGAELQVDFPKIVTDPDEKSAASSPSANASSTSATSATSTNAASSTSATPAVAPKSIENKSDSAY